jgi:hypothetical protein
MRRREFIALVGGTAARPLVARAQLARGPIRATARGAVVTTFPSTLNQRTDHGDGGPLVLGAQPSGPPIPGSVTLVTVPGRFALYSTVNSP